MSFKENLDRFLLLEFPSPVAELISIEIEESGLDDEDNIFISLNIVMNEKVIYTFARHSTGLEHYYELSNFHKFTSQYKNETLIQLQDHLNAVYGLYGDALDTGGDF